MSNTPDAQAPMGVAIVGFAARLPGAADVEQFWRNLREGVESITFFSDEELRAAGVPPEELAHPDFVPAKGYMKDAELFDAGFFGYTPREATVLDPQHRVFLECAWEALENAGYNPQQPQNFTGVFASCSVNSYLLRFLGSEAFRSLDAMQLCISSEKDTIATRVAYKLNLRGPAMTIQTACSSSLTAVSQACQSLLAYQCDTALAGGVSVKNPRVGGYVFQQGAIFSPDGHCRAFDAKSAGTLTGEGVALVVLKRLEDAIADGDTIHAVIKGFALNNDGSNKVGYTAPSVEGQAQVIAMAHAFAGVDPDTITYVETHGTATDLGDPIEISGLTQAFRQSTARRQFCGVGSVKTNIGHTDAAAGVTSLIKTALALEHREIPPSLHFEKPNPHIDFENSPFYVVDRLTPWRSEGGPRRAGVSAFGIGGTNVHVVLEEAPGNTPPAPSGPWKLLTFSARTESALDASIERIATHLREHPGQDLADVAHTLHVGRREFDWRAFAVCRDTADALEALGAGARLHRMRIRAHERPVAFGFTGQGSQYPGMGAGLYRDERAFREAADECFAILRERSGLDLAPILYPAAGDAKAAEERLRDTRYAQPALFVTEYALARLWMSRGVQPDALIGHSIGEYVAACLAGVMTLPDALTLVAERGRLMGSVEPGSMLAVPMPEGELAPMLGAELSLAAVNAPSLCVASGPHAAIDALESRLRALGIQPTRLHTSHAFHSRMMDPVLEEFGRCVARVPLSEPRMRYVSNVTGDWITAEQAIDPGYWVRHLRGTVRFADGVRRLMEDGVRVFLEVGPGATLSGLARSQLGTAGQDRIFGSLRAARQEGEDEALFVESLGRMWLSGCRVDWEAFGRGEGRRRVPLPTYPFERSRHWIDSAPSLDALALASATRRKPDIADWLYMPSWRQAPRPLDAAGEPNHSWLILADDLGIGERLAARIASRGESVRLARAGAAFEARDDGSFTVAPASEMDHERLFAALSTAGAMPDRVVSLWAVTAGEARTASERDALVDRCFWSATCVARALGRNAGVPAQLTFVANGLHRVTGGEALTPEKATLYGPCQVAPREWPHVSCRMVDVAPEGAGPAAAAAVAEQLEAELRGELTPQPVAYRGGMRWVRDHVPVRIGSPKAFPRVRRDGTYLVTGGLGGIGLALAEALARECAARLVLVARRSFPAREGWDAWLRAHASDDATSVLIRKLQAMEALGAQVMVASADVADAARMAAVVEQARARFGAIDGVIHSAGVPAGGIIELKTREAANAILAPKVRGTRVLEEVLAREPLDFFALCSSLTATLPSAGQLDYTAANAFQDVFAQSRAGGPSPTVSIEWDAWKETGMAVDTAVPAAMAAIRRQSLETGIATAEGVEAFRRALAGGLPQVLVSTCDLHARLEAATSAPKPAQEEAAPATVDAQPQRRALSAPYVAPRTQTERAIATIWEDLFGIERMGVDDDFIEADGHSLLAIQIVARIGKELGVKLPVNAIFEHPTIAQIAEQVEAATRKAAEQDSQVAQLMQMVEKLSDEDVRRMLAEHHADT